MLPVLPVLLGIAGLWGGVVLAARGATRMLRRPGVLQPSAGLAVLHAAAALPEVAVGVAGGLVTARGGDASGLVVGTAVGSTLARSTLILGAAALVGAVGRRDGRLRSRAEGLALLGALGLAGGLALDGVLDLLDGLLMASAAFAYLAFRVRTHPGRSTPGGSAYGLLPDAFLVALGTVVAMGSGLLVVTGGAAVADAWGVQPLVVGLLVLGVGASLPELILGLTSAARGVGGLSTDAVLASGALGLLLTLAGAAVCAPVVVPTSTLRVDLPAAALAALALTTLHGRPDGPGRRHGLALVLAFVTFALVRMALA